MDNLSDKITPPDCPVCNAKAGEDHIKGCSYLEMLRAGHYPRLLDQNGRNWENNRITQLESENEHLRSLIGSALPQNISSGQ